MVGNGIIYNPNLISIPIIKFAAKPYTKMAIIGLISIIPIGGMKEKGAIIALNIFHSV